MLDLIMATLSRTLVPLFFVGMAGSTLVVAITFAHDVVDFFTDEDAGTAGSPQNG